MAYRKKSGSFVFKVLVNGTLFVLCCALLIHRHFDRKSDLKDARKKACYANMRLLLGAVEMYNMDHATCIKSLTPADYADKKSVLISQKYLRDYLTLPTEECVYFSKGDLSTAESVIFCKKHGAVEPMESLANMGLVSAEQAPGNTPDIVTEVK
jgi:hypothetical protein